MQALRANDGCRVWAGLLRNPIGVGCRRIQIPGRASWPAYTPYPPPEVMGAVDPLSSIWNLGGSGMEYLL